MKFSYLLLKKIGFNLLGDKYSTIPYVTYTITNSPAGCKLPPQDKQNLWIIYINVEEPITAQGALDELNCHQTPCGKSKVDISLCRRKSYQRIDLEDINSIFYQVISVISHIEVCLTYKPPTPRKIGEALKGTQRQFCKEAFFVKYDKNKDVSLLSYPIQIKSLPEVIKFLRSIIAPSIKEGGCSSAFKCFALHFANDSSQIQSNDLISPTVEWHIMNPSESTLLSWLCTDSLLGLWM